VLGCAVSLIERVETKSRSERFSSSSIADFAEPKRVSCAVHDYRIDSSMAFWNRIMNRDGGKVSRMEVKMPGDPKECRQHALNCVRFAQTATTPQAREHFANLARTWIGLADDLERSQAFLDALDHDAEPKRRTG